MLFRYKVIGQDGQMNTGEIDAISNDSAIASLQRRGLIVVGVDKIGEAKGLVRALPFLGGGSVPMRDVVIMSRQIATLFEAQVSAVKAFNLMGEASSNPTLRATLQALSQDVQGGITIAEGLNKYPKVFSDFYVNMVRAGEESGKLTDVFSYLADYLDRQHELTSKTKNALIYPTFVILTFFIVMILMLTLVIPKLSQILIESGQEIPLYTKVVIALSNFFVHYGFILAIAVVVGGIFVAMRLRSNGGKQTLDTFKLKIPYIGDLFKKLYLSRMADNIHTMLSSGIPIVRTLEITGSVVGNKIYEDILRASTEGIKSGRTLSTSLAQYPEIPQIMVSMIQVGEETGSMGNILDTLAKFYKREVENSVDTLIGLIEPAMIIALGVGVGFLLTSVLVPIYNIASNIQ